MADIIAAVTSSLFLADNLLSSLYQETKLQKNVRNGVEEIKNWLMAIQAYLKDTEGQEGNEGQKVRARLIREVAYDIEDALDEFMVQVPDHHHTHTISKKAHKVKHSLTDRPALHKMSSNIGDIKRKTVNILSLDQFLAGVTNADEGSSTGMRVDVTPHIPEEDEILGFENHIEKIIDQLNGEEPMRKTLAVVGIAGSGKSVLAKSVYNDIRVRRKFDCHAWVHVTRSFGTEELLRNLLKQFCKGRKEEISHEGDPREELKLYLQQRRYIVVLDDIWSKQDYERIANALPNGFAGSAIIVTTQMPDVVSSCVQSPPHMIHELNGLPWKMAWELFCKKAFYASNGECPDELVKWSQNIVKRCEGLPLAIVAVGCLLSKKQQLPIEWKKLHDSLGSEIGSNSNLSTIGKALLRSYNDLPSHLKSCFLYLSVFPEDCSVKRGRLIRLWIAEGFVKKTSGNSNTLEEVAEDYLNELIGRNLVHISARDFDGRPRSCRVLNPVREFIILKSEEVNFVTVFTEPNTSSGERDRRLSVHFHDARPIDLSQHSGLSSVRSLFVFGADKLCLSKIQNKFHDFKLLRLLDMQNSPLDSFPEEIVDLILLRYLSLRQTNIKSVPRSIEKLTQLETLDLKHTQVTRLPKAIRRLRNLRHILVYSYDVKNYDTFDSAIGVEIFPGIGALSSLQKLSLIKASKNRGVIIKELGDLMQLRKLGMVNLRSEDGKNLCSSIQKMTVLSTLDLRSTGKEEYLDLEDMRNPPALLQRLYLKGRLLRFPVWIGSLHSLVRIGLRWSRLNNSPLDALQDLPNLMELQMVDAFIGQELVFNASKFVKLKILHIEQFESLNTIILQAGAMSKLKKLTIIDCKNLMMLPLGISYLSSIEELLLYSMPQELIATLRRNSEDREMVRHIPVIRSFTLVENHRGWSIENLS